VKSFKKGKASMWFRATKVLYDLLLNDLDDILKNKYQFDQYRSTPYLNNRLEIDFFESSLEC